MNRKHGMSGTKPYRTWAALKNRCFNTRSTKYPIYGGRGITVCERWLGENGFINFYADMGDPPSPTHSIDRIDVNGNYCPENCRWATPREEACNTRDNLLYTMDGKTQCLSLWLDDSKIGRTTVQLRLALGWSLQDALTIPPQKKKSSKLAEIEYLGRTQSLYEWAKELSKPYTLIYGRLQRGWSVEKAFTTPARPIKKRQK